MSEIAIRPEEIGLVFNSTYDTEEKARIFTERCRTSLHIAGKYLEELNTFLEQKSYKLLGYDTVEDYIIGEQIFPNDGVHKLNTVAYGELAETLHDNGMTFRKIDEASGRSGNGTLSQRAIQTAQARRGEIPRWMKSPSGHTKAVFIKLEIAVQSKQGRGCNSALLSDRYGLSTGQVSQVRSLLDKIEVTPYEETMFYQDQLKKRVSSANSDWRYYTEQGKEAQQFWRESLSDGAWETMREALAEHDKETNVEP